MYLVPLHKIRTYVSFIVHNTYPPPLSFVVVMFVIQSQCRLCTFSFRLSFFSILTLTFFDILNIYMLCILSSVFRLLSLFPPFIRPVLVYRSVSLACMDPINSSTPFLSFLFLSFPPIRNPDFHSHTSTCSCTSLYLTLPYYYIAHI